MTAQFKTPLDFRKSLEAKLQARALKTGEDLQRLRRKVAFDRFLARIFHQDPPEFYLKGGYAMELRIAHARATRDIDFTFTRRFRNEEELVAELVLADLQSLADLDLKDHFVYQIRKTELNLIHAPYGGARYLVSSLVAGKVFVQFHLDVGVDFLLDKTETLQGSDWLGFCGISAPMIPMISVEQQFAEKLHAYTLPRQTVNSRTKDLVDLILLLDMREPKLELLSQMLLKVFEKRATHPLPSRLEPPPVEWGGPFQTLATECGLTLDMGGCFRRIGHFYGQLMAKTVQVGRDLSASAT